MASLRRGPLRAYRIADRRHPLFDGTGSFLCGSRWNSKGRRVIYAAETYAGALLEMLVHANLGHVPRTHAYIEITIPESIAIEEISPQDVPGWENDDQLAGRAYGDAWYREKRTAVLLAPSLVTRGVERNVVINQEHAEFAAIGAGPPRDVEWDRRLFRPVSQLP